MDGFWEKIEPAVTAALLALIPALGLWLRSWLAERQRHWESSAREVHQEAVQLGDSLSGRVSEATLESWAVRALRQRNPKLTEERARALVRKAAADSPAPSEPGEPVDRERTTLPGSGPPRAS